jgi:UDP-N-acetylmuramoyl-tripeptide--D-alanyl-D-alanine ligase
LVVIQDSVDERINYIHRAAVLEYGMAYPGVISEHCKIIKPNIGVITNIGLAHIGNFSGNVEELAKAKAELVKGTNPSGMIFINADDINSKLLHANEFAGKVFTVGINSKSDYQGKNIAYSEQGMTFSMILKEKEYNFFIPLLGEHNVYNALFAIGVADQLGFLPIEMQTGLKNVKKPKHRLELYNLKDNKNLVCHVFWRQEG